MKKLILLIVVFTLFCLLIVTKTFGAYPKYSSYVNDFANVLQENTEQALNTKLSDFDKKTTNQIAVVTVETTEPETIEEYSINLAEEWKPGQKGKDNGVILLFAMEDRKMRIEVGRGLEGELTDVESKHILDDTIRPEFKAGIIDSGVTKGVDAVIFAISSETVAPATNSNEGGGIIIFLIVIGVIVAVGAIAFSSRMPFGGEGDNHLRGVWVPKKGSKWGTKSIGKIEKEYFVPFIPPIVASTFRPSSSDDDSLSSSGSSGSDWGGVSFGGGSFSGGGASSGW